MITNNQYVCEICGQHFSNKKECVKHEAKHYNLTPDEYAKWGKLNAEVEHRSYRVNNRNNALTRYALENAVHAVLAFEEKHNLTDKEKPRRFPKKEDI